MINERTNLVDEDCLPKFFGQLSNRIGIPYSIEESGQLPLPR